MSMLSSMCDNLRMMAKLVRDYDYDVISHELRKAADNIWELRCKCSDLMDEREELSRRLEHATEMNSMLMGMGEHDRRAIASMLTTIDGINLSERIRELEDENARLRCCLSDDAENARQIMGKNARMRELIQKAWKWEKNGCYECPLERDCKADSVYDGDCGMAVEIEKEMRELGIEVK